MQTKVGYTKMYINLSFLLDIIIVDLSLLRLPYTRSPLPLKEWCGLGNTKQQCVCVAEAEKVYNG